jgi:hypothetical protein
VNLCSGCRFTPVRDNPLHESTVMLCESRKPKCERGFWVNERDTLTRALVQPNDEILTVIEQRKDKMK